jgi:hypothetical protein
MLSAIYEWGNQVAWIAAAVTAVLFFYAIIYAFPNARLAALQQARDVAEQENRAFCEKHGMPFGTREHTLCQWLRLRSRASLGSPARSTSIIK